MFQNFNHSEAEVKQLLKMLLSFALTVAVVFAKAGNTFYWISTYLVTKPACPVHINY